MQLNYRIMKKLDLNFTVLGGIESDILMSPEMGNLPWCFKGTYRFHVQLLQVGQECSVSITRFRWH